MSRTRVVGYLAAAVALVVGGVVLATSLHHASPRRSALAPADRAPLRVASGRLVHPTLGFSFAQLPPSFTETHAVNDVTDGGGAMYAYVDSTAGTLMQILVAGTKSGTRDLGGDVAAWKASVTSGVTARGSFEETSATAGDGSAAIDGVVAMSGTSAPVHAEFHALERRGQWFDVMVVVMSRAPGALRDVLASFRADAH